MAKDLTDFGILYPRGHIVAVFHQGEDAEKARRDLLTGGYDPADCVLATPEQVAEGARKNLQDHTGFLSTLGKSDEAVAMHLEAAEQGHTCCSNRR